MISTQPNFICATHEAHRPRNDDGPTREGTKPSDLMDGLDFPESIKNKVHGNLTLIRAPLLLLPLAAPLPLLSLLPTGGATPPPPIPIGGAAPPPPLALSLSGSPHRQPLFS